MRDKDKYWDCLDEAMQAVQEGRTDAALAWLDEALEENPGGAEARNGEYRERYMRMRNDYRQLLRSRTDSVRRSGRLSADKEQSVLIEQLDVALKEEAELHRKESQRLNEELYLNACKRPILRRCCCAACAS